MNHSDLIDAEIDAEFWRLLEGIEGSSGTSGPQGVHQNSMINYPSTADTNDTAFTPTLTSSMGTLTGKFDYAQPGDADDWAMPAQGFLDAGSVAPDLEGPHWTGVSLYAADSAATTPNPVMSPRSSATPPGSQDEVAWDFGPENTMYYPTSSAFGSASEGTLVAPEFGTNISGVTTYPVGWATNEVAWTIPIAPEISATAAIGKRRHDESHDDTVPVATNSHGMPPQKRARGSMANVILKTGRSVTRTHHKSAARIPDTRINVEPKQPVRGAEMLATTDPHGLHHRSLLGPSLQQGWAVEDADGRLLWAEGSVEEMARCTDNTAQQQQQQQEEEVQQKHIEIPGTLNTGYQSLLMATQADRERGVIPEIRCRLCPQARFKKWGDFKRHCDCTETHPLSICFCEDCGDYFARSDSCQRHRGHRPAECLQATPEKAEAKRIATQTAHDAFVGRLQEYLTTGEEYIGMSFSKIIKDMFPDSSKKRISRK